MAVNMTAFWDNSGTVIPSGLAEYVVAEQPIAEYDNWFNYEIASDMQKVIDDVINKFNANTILKADTNSAPVALTIGLNTIVGRASGSISALTATESRSLLNVSDGAESNLLEEVSNVLREKSSGGYDNDFVVGSPQLDDDGNTAHDARVWFDKSKGAFRAGRTSSIQWNSAYVGDNSHAEGEDTIASGQCAHAEGYGGISSGNYSHAEGYDTSATDGYAHAEGRDTTASGQCAHAEGFDSVASGNYSHAEGGGTVASGNYSHAMGRNSSAYITGQHSHANGLFSVTGDAQLSTIPLRIETSGTGWVNMTTDGGAVSSDSNMLLVPENCTWGFTVYITARQIAGTSGTIGDSGIYKLEGGIKRDGSNNTMLIGTVLKTVIAEDQVGWDVRANADNTNEWLRIQVTGETGKSIHCVASANLVEVG